MLDTSWKLHHPGLKYFNEPDGKSSSKMKEQKKKHFENAVEQVVPFSLQFGKKGSMDWLPCHELYLRAFSDVDWASLPLEKSQHLRALSMVPVKEHKEQFLSVIMPCSMAPHLTFPFTNCGLPTFKGLVFILWLSLYLLAECEDTRKGPVSTKVPVSKKVPVTLLKEHYRIKVTFDPNTAHPWLVVSADRTYVEWGDGPQNVPDNPERFNSTPALLGLPGFASGKHYWEVEYGDQREWAVGVALESVDRKVYHTLVPEEGIWQEGLWWLRTLGSRSHTRPVCPGIIGVFVDYEAGTVVFYIDMKVILKRASFNGQKVFPFFYLGGGVNLKLIY